MNLKQKFNYFVDLCLAVLFVAMVLSLAFESREFHDGIGVTLIIFIFIHIALHWRQMCGIVKIYCNGNLSDKNK